MRLRLAIAALAVAGGVILPAAPVFAAHDHYVVTPNGNCHQVAAGQTAITEGGGAHKFHLNVHLGATEDVLNRTLGDGHAQVDVYKDSCP